ncbi:MFS transporter [Acidimicrobiia bacterium]|jgi:MFS family permease|nr:MFS transporter [Candidatus Actinomarina sp.]MDA8964032.1 MFS transporter [Acidimicrobiia bacterium]MDA9844777.1 MFS transporter [Acidimicrobiia bacterium]MDB4813817.1 MFS transporter [Acidimicrobiia bacterium]MDB4834141.1 MFS transporter [Acidimicrobiia bacterium]|tara:strand:+ start:1121 stop:2296 length:1176 start_codon:yes stop_codon:yes gene_type:complete
MISEVKKIFHLLLSVAFSSTGFIAAVTITVLAAREVSSNPYLIGFPNAVGVAGAVIGTQMFDKMSQKYSKNKALSNTFLIGSLGGLVQISSLLIDSFILLLVGAFILGIGQSAALQTRYVASFVASESFKATALSLAVWFSVFGSIFGPRLVGEYSAVFENWLGSDLIVGYFIATFGMFLAGLSVLLFSQKDSALNKKLVIEKSLKLSELDSTARLLTKILVLNHFVMVLIMSATPLHIKDIGETIKLVGTIISYHTLGMFLLSPILGKLVDKYGSKLFAVIGSLILILSCVVSLFNTNILFLKIGLYLLGLGWNFTYIAISSAISNYSISNGINLNIKSDSLVFVGSSIAHISLGFTYLNFGYTNLIYFGLLIGGYLLFSVKKFTSLKSL